MVISQKSIPSYEVGLMKLIIIDYGVGNLASVQSAFKACGYSGTLDITISAEPKDIQHADRILLPGVGSFSDAMALLNQAHWPEAIYEAVIQKGIPLLGICLGMQLLATEGEEGGNGTTPVAGLNLIPGQVQKLCPKDATERLPHVGWNSIEIDRESPLLSGIANGSDFYFVHSYHFQPTHPEDSLSHTDYCGRFTSMISRAHIFGAQFHPEKSSKQGFQLLRNFLTLL